MASIVTIARYYEPAEALAAAAFLRAHGFVAILPEYHHATLAWHHVFAMQGVRLWTLDSMANDALDLLQTANAPRQEAMEDAAQRHPRFRNMTPAEFLLATAAFLLSGLPLPLWKRRRLTDS